MRKLVLALSAFSLLAGSVAATATAPCRDSKGKFVKCSHLKAKAKVCRDSKGKFKKCK